MKRIVLTFTLCVCLVSFLRAAQVDIQRTDYFKGAPVISILQLPKPVLKTTYSFYELLGARGGKVELSNDQLRSEQISQIFWAGYGVNDAQIQRRTVASFDNSYSLLLYLITNDSVYVYIPSDNTLAKIMDTDMRSKIAVAANRDNAIYVGSASIILAGSPSKAGYKQPRQGRMIMLYEAGKVAQNMELAAMTEGLGFITTEKMDGARITSLLRMPSGFEPICIMTIGRLSEPLSASVEVAPQAAGETAKPVEKTVEVQVPEPVTKPEASVEKEKKVILFIPRRNFPEQAYIEVSRLLKLSGIKVDVVSTTLETIRGDMGSELAPNMLMRDVVPSDYDGIVILTGNFNTRGMIDEDTVGALAARVYNAGGVVATMGQGVEIIARAGLLRGGVKVTAEMGMRRTISQNGGDYVSDPIVIDGRFVTAKDSLNSSFSSLETGPTGNIGFAEAVIKTIKKEDQSQ